MARLLLLPEIAADTTEATLTAWSLTPESTFGENQSLAVVETAKAAVDITAESDGVLLATLVAEGTDVVVGQPLAVLGDPGEVLTDLSSTLAALGVSDSEGPKPTTSAEPEISTPAIETPPTEPGPRRIFSSPLARRLAGEAGLDIAAIPGTGPRNRVLRRDVEAAAKAQAEGRPAPAKRVEPAPAAGTWHDIPHSRMRRTIAARLTESKRTTPHFYLRGTVRADALLDLRSRINSAGSTRVSVNDLIVRAVALAHLRVPEMNAIWTEDAVRRFDTVDVAVAVATDDGLVTPVVRGVESLSLGPLSQAIAELGGRARSGALTPAELAGGSITVSNLGMYGVDEFAAIINPPHAAILAVGAAVPEPAVVDGQVRVVQNIHVTLSVDHRPVDGVIAARWMAAFIELLQEPINLLL